MHYKGSVIDILIQYLYVSVGNTHGKGIDIIQMLNIYFLHLCFFTMLLLKEIKRSSTDIYKIALFLFCTVKAHGKLSYQKISFLRNKYLNKQYELVFILLKRQKG